MPPGGTTAAEDWTAAFWPALLLWGWSFFTRHDIDQEVEHVGLGQGRRNVGALQSTALVLFGVDPGAHGEFGDENVTALGKQDGSFGRDHLDFWVGLHNLLDASQGELVQLVVVFVRLELGDLLLPVCVEDVAVVTREALVYLRLLAIVCAGRRRHGIVHSATSQ